MRMRSQWRLVEVKNGIAFIEDMDGPRSVTNDAENVYSDIQHAMAAMVAENSCDVRVVYRDTEGSWWEIVGQRMRPDSPYINRVEFLPWHGMVWDTLSN